MYEDVTLQTNLKTFSFSYIQLIHNKVDLEFIFSPKELSYFTYFMNLKRVV